MSNYISEGRAAVRLLLPVFLLLCTCVRAQRADPCALHVGLAAVPSSCDEITLTPDALNYRLEGSYREVSWVFATTTGSDTVRGEDFGTYTFRSSGTITLRVGNSCRTVQRRVAVSVEPSVPLALTGAGVYCSGSDPVRLTANVPGGIWIGEGIIDSRRGVFDPGAASPGVKAVSYTVVEGSCPYFGVLELTVIGSEEVMTVDTTVCKNDGVLQLDVRPAGGHWSGSGIVDSVLGHFDPAAVRPGSHFPRYTYRDVSGCLIQAEPRVVVERTPTLRLPDTLVLCRRDTTMDLNRQLGLDSKKTTVGYRVAGVALAGRTINPVTALKGPGTYPLEVTLRRGSCTVQHTTVLKLVELPDLRLTSPATVCVTEGQLILGANLPGGGWEGPGVDPRTGRVDLTRTGPGTYHYTYRMASGTPCAQRQTVALTVLPAPESLTAGPDLILCADSVSRELRLEGAFPAGGSFAGFGLRGGEVVDLGQLRHDTTYTYSYSVTEAGGCGGTARRSLRVNSLPTIAVTAPDTVCLGQEFAPGVVATGGRLTYDLGDGRQGSGPPPRVAYGRGDTTYAMRLVTSGPAGCRAQAVQRVYVQPPPQAGFALAVASGCAPLTLKPLDGSSFATKNYWLVAGTGVGEVLDGHVLTGYDRDTTVRVEQVVTNGCGTDRASQSVRVGAKPRANFGLDRSASCPPFRPRLTNTSTGSATAYRWTFGQGGESQDTDPVAPTYRGQEGRGATDYNIVLRAVNGCGQDSLERSIRVLATTVRAAIELDERAGCAPFEVAPVSGSTPGTSLHWSLLDTAGQQVAAATEARAPVFRLERPGRYALVLEASGCGKSRDTVNLVVRPGPQLAIRAPQRVCRRDTVHLSVVGAELTGYDWQLGQQGHSSVAAPQVAFLHSGPQTVNLVATGRSTGCVHHLATTIEVLPDPVIRPVVSDGVGCAPLRVTYSVPDTTGELSYSWDFGTAADASALSAPVHTYATPGQYIASVRATDGAGCSTVVPAPPVTVREPPVADFEARVDLDPEVLGDVTFRNRSAEADRFVWSFGDSTGSVAVAPDHRYAAYAEYAVRLIATAGYAGGGSCSDTLVRRVRPERFGRFFVPSALAPDHGAGEPTVWGAKGYAVARYELRVYSAYGQLVYRTDELEAGIPTGRWDGTLGGGGSDPAPQGTYTWRATVTYLDGQRDNLLGTVTVVR